MGSAMTAWEATRGVSMENMRRTRAKTGFAAPVAEGSEKDIMFALV